MLQSTSNAPIFLLGPNGPRAAHAYPSAPLDNEGFQEQVDLRIEVFAASGC